MRIISEMVECFRGAGYVLNFGDGTFAEYFADEFNIDIDAPEFCEDGQSKGKRLRCFLRKADNTTALRVIESLWAHRQYEMERIGRSEQLVGLEGKIELIKARLKSGQSSSSTPLPHAFDHGKFDELKQRLYKLRNVPPQRRGYEFETYLTDCFNAFGLSGRRGFRNTGEQIDGSFLLDHEVYLLEAKWTDSPIGVAELRAFLGKLEKASWTRGVFVSYNGFIDVGLTAFGNAKSLICVNGEDIYEALGSKVSLDELLRRKVRTAAETGLPFTPFSKLKMT
ncbi:restriction endonuclease [Pseudoblastomonas halimionae]|nr:restriction endonuclease [Alteriqipengyuania halimionae]